MRDRPAPLALAAQPAPARRRPGRPRKVVDARVVEAMAAVFCTQSEIAAELRCSVDTLSRHFAESIKRGMARGKISLRRRQFELAMSGNTGMLVWLGKQYLDQSDTQTYTGPDQGPIQHTVRVVYETAPVVTYETRAVASTPAPALPAATAQRAEPDARAARQGGERPAARLAGGAALRGASSVPSLAQKKGALHA